MDHINATPRIAAARRCVARVPIVAMLALSALLFLPPAASAEASDDPGYFELTDAPVIAVDWSKGNTLAGSRRSSILPAGP